MRRYAFSIGMVETGQRLDRYLTGRLPDSVSRAMIQRGIREGLVTVGGRVVKTHYRLRPGDQIEAAFAQLPVPSRNRPLVAQPIPLDIVYEDDELLVVNKPAGLVTHPAPGHWDGTLVNAILWHLSNAECGMRNAELKAKIPHSAFRIPHLARAGIVHRLDKDTSGLLLVAKTDVAHTALSRQLKARMIRRRYLALVEGHVPLNSGTIDAPVGRHLAHRKVMAVRHLGGRSAVTHYRVLKRFGSALRVQGSGLGAVAPTPEPRAPSDFPYTLIEVSLETGRTHQIRVHMAHLGHPVLGDPVYGRRPPSYWAGRGISRQLLHAFSLRFVHPTTRTPVEVSARMPEDMARWIPGGPLEHKEGGCGE